VVFASDSRAGGLPSPSDTFAIVELADPEGLMLYSQEPIDDALWTIDQLGPERAEIALEISDL
jgi:hypothetical protein